MLSWAILLGMLVSFACADDKYVIVEAEGIGKDRNSAIEAAWLEGIRQAVGSYIDAKTELNNDQLTERIISYSRGLVEKYEITSVDDSLAAEGVYKVKMRLSIVRELLRDGAKHATAGGSEISFSPADLKRKQEELDAKAARELEAKNAAAETAKRKARAGVDLLEAMLNRYKPEEFLSCYIVGTPAPVKDKPDVFSLKVELNFNEKLFKENFIPDLIQVLDQIASVKKNFTLIKYKNELRAIASKEGSKYTSPVSIITRSLENRNDYILAIYDKPERFGVRFYGFNNNDNLEQIKKLFAEFQSRASRVKGILLELVDDEKEIIHSVEKKFDINFLISNATRDGEYVWSIQPTILCDGLENLRTYVPFTLEMPAEIIPYVKTLRASLLLGEAIKTARRPGWLGVSVGNTPNNQGALIEEVFPDNPAYNAGLKPGDIIIRINDRNIKTFNELIKYLGTLHEGDEVRINVLRQVNNNKMPLNYVIKVTLGAKP